MTAPALSTHARRVLDEASVAKGARVLVACSGGVDSQVLLDVLAHLAGRGRLEVVACGVDHGLRPEAASELDRAEALALARGTHFHRVAVTVENGANLQARARAARWGALERVATEQQCSFVATGHHQGDRAETVLMRILRGAPLSGLAVLPPHEGPRLRPLIGATRTEIVAHAERRKLAYAEDPANRDPRYVRTRIRAEVMPLLRQLDPRVDEHLAALADRAGDDTERERARVFATILAATGVAPSSRAVAAVVSGKKALLADDREAEVREPGGPVVITPSHRR